MATNRGGFTGTVQAPVQRVIDALLDVERYPQWQSHFLECRVHERDGDGRPALAEFRVDAKVRKLRYLARFDYDLPHGYGWTQVDGDLADLRGRYAFAPRPDGGTEVTVDVVFDVGFYVPRPVQRLVRDQALRTLLSGLRRRVAG